MAKRIPLTLLVVASLALTLSIACAGARPVPATPVAPTAPPAALAPTVVVPPTAAAPTATVPPTATAVGEGENRVPGPAPTADPTTRPQPTPTATPVPAAAGLNTRLWRQSATGLQGAAREGLALAANGQSLQLALAREGAGYVPRGQVASEEHTAQFPFNNAVLSWNADAPHGTSLRFDLRVRVGETWSSWYTMGEWTGEGGASTPGQGDQWGKVAVDTLELNEMAAALQYRVTLSTSDATATPALRTLSVVYADLTRPLSGTARRPERGWARDLPVPVHSQMLEDRSIAGLICSPTSLTMVMEYYGVSKPVAEVASRVRDRMVGIFGNWPLNTAFAASQGLETHVDRFFSVEQLEAEIAAGRPVIVSIRFDPGELDGAPISSTDGHLIVVRGFTSQGDVIVNDPAAPDLKTVRRVYKRQQLAHVWLDHGGIVYVVKPQGE